MFSVYVPSDIYRSLRDLLWWNQKSWQNSGISYPSPMLQKNQTTRIILMGLLNISFCGVLKVSLSHNDHTQFFFNHTWLISTELDDFMGVLDTRLAKTQQRQLAVGMVAKKVRKEGTPSDSLPPPDAPSWAVKDHPQVAGMWCNNYCYMHCHLSLVTSGGLASSPGHSHVFNVTRRKGERAWYVISRVRRHCVSYHESKKDASWSFPFSAIGRFVSM